MPEPKRLDASADTLGDNRYVFVLAIAEDHGKFLTPIACDDSSIRHRLSDTGSDRVQTFIASLMAVRIVVGLEAVDIVKRSASRCSC